MANSLEGGEGLSYVTGAVGLSFVASLGGHVILQSQQEIPNDFPFTYHEARLFNQYVRHRSEYFGATIQLEKVLNIAWRGRPDQTTGDILPVDLGARPSSDGEECLRWGTKRLMDEGRKAAEAAGISQPTRAQVLRYGLLEAAIQDPIKCEDTETGSIVRMALFDLGPAAASASSNELRYVAGQVNESLQDHLNDSTEQFNRWIVDPDSNLIHRVAKRKDCPLERGQVRLAMLELGWQSFLMLGQCVDAQMRAFRDAIPERLTNSEQWYYDQVYLANPALGSLPLLLLHDRIDFLEEAILRTWNQPDGVDGPAVALSMLYYYAQLASNRRAADRRYKQNTGWQRVM